MSLRDELKKAIQETDDTASIDDLTENVEAAVIRFLGPDGLVDLAKQLQQVDLKARADAGYGAIAGGLQQLREDVSTWRWDEEIGGYVLDPNGDLVIYDGAHTASAWMNSLKEEISGYEEEEIDLSAPIPKSFKSWCNKYNTTPTPLKLQIWKRSKQALRDELSQAMEADPPNWTYWEALQKQLDIEEGKAV